MPRRLDPLLARRSVRRRERRSTSILAGLPMLLLVLAIVACAPQAEPTRTATTGLPSAATAPLADGVVEIRSDDGGAVLRLPLDGLPAGTAQDDIRITALTVAPSDGTTALMPTRLYQLEPDGLQLELPATLAVRLPAGSADEGLMVLHLFGDALESLVPNVVPGDAGEDLTVTVELTHFSAIWFGGAPLFSVEPRSPSHESYVLGERVPFEVAYRRQFVSETIDVRVTDTATNKGRAESWDVGVDFGDFAYSAGTLYPLGALERGPLAGVPPAGNASRLITAEGTSVCAEVGYAHFAHVMYAEVPVRRRLANGQQEDLTVRFVFEYSATTTCVAAAVDYASLLDTLFPPGAMLTGEAVYVPVGGGACGTSSYTSPLRLERGRLGDTFLVVQVHGRNREQRSTGAANEGMILTFDDVTSHDEMYFLYFDETPRLDGGRLRLQGYNFHGPEGSIPGATTASDLQRLREALRHEGVVARIIAESAAGDFTLLRELLLFAPSVCPAAVEVRIEPRN